MTIPFLPRSLGSAAHSKGLSSLSSKLNFQRRASLRKVIFLMGLSSFSWPSSLYLIILRGHKKVVSAIVLRSLCRRRAASVTEFERKHVDEVVLVVPDFGNFVAHHLLFGPVLDLTEGRNERLRAHHYTSSSAPKI